MDRLLRNPVGLAFLALAVIIFAGLHLFLRAGNAAGRRRALWPAGADYQRL